MRSWFEWARRARAAWVGFDFLGPSSLDDRPTASICSTGPTCLPHPSSSSCTTLTGETNDCRLVGPGCRARRPRSSELTIPPPPLDCVSGRLLTRTRTDTCSSACPPRSGESSRRSRTRETCSTPTSCEHRSSRPQHELNRTKRRAHPPCPLVNLVPARLTSASTSAHSVKKLQATVGSTRQEIEDALRSLPVVSPAGPPPSLSFGPTRPTDSERSQDHGCLSRGPHGLGSGCKFNMM